MCYTDARKVKAGDTIALKSTGEKFVVKDKRYESFLYGRNHICFSDGKDYYHHTKVTLCD